MFGALGNLSSLVAKANELGGRLEELKQKLKTMRATGSAGGGLVEVEANGLSEILSCRIDPTLFDGGDRELVEDLVRGATNQALTKSRQLHAEAMQSLAGGLAIPGLQDSLSKLIEGDTSS